MRRLGSLLTILFGVPLLLILSFGTAARAQTGARLTFGVNPTIFRAGQPASAELSVSSVSTLPLTLYAGNSFMFFVDSSLGAVSSVTPSVAVESSSLVPGDFSVSFAGGQNPVVITYNGAPKAFAFGDSFSVKISLITSAQPGPGKVSLSSQFVSSVNGALPFTTVSVVDFANTGTSAVAHDQTLIGDGTTAMPLGIAPGGVSTVDLAMGAVTSDKIAPLTVVRNLNGRSDNVTLAAGSNISVTPSGNTLTIAAPNVLMAVAHDSTLTGDGTSSSPLGVANGASNPVQVFVASVPGATLFTDARVILQKTVPAGSYVINAKFSLHLIDQDDQTAACTLSTGDSAKLRLQGGGSLDPSPTFWDGSLTLLDTATFNADTTITASCQGHNFVLNRAIMTATRVGSIQ